MSLAFGRYSARSGVRARRATERGSKPGQPCTHGINQGVKKDTSRTRGQVRWQTKNIPPHPRRLSS
eukprot:scaffold68934_cov21-Phaeocystis_antarctica.AAC.1